MVIATMRAMVKQRISLGLVLLTATSMFAAANCDNGDSVVSVNVSYDMTAMDVQTAVSKLQVTISPKSGGTPVMTDIDITRDTDGGITNTAYKRVTVNGLSGMADVTVVALDGSGTNLLSASTTVDLREHGAVAAFVKFARTPPAMPDAGTTGSGGSEGSGGTTGSGGANGGAGGEGGNTMAATQNGSGGNRGTGGA